MKRGTLIAVLMVVVGVFGNGCSSVGSRFCSALDMSGRYKASKFYPGVVTDFTILTQPVRKPKDIVMAPVYVPYACADLPLSLVCDTLVFPMDAGWLTVMDTIPSENFSMDKHLRAIPQ
jgi:uncharacterized protein YceK